MDRISGDIRRTEAEGAIAQCAGISQAKGQRKREQIREFFFETCVSGKKLPKEKMGEKETCGVQFKVF